MLKVVLQAFELRLHIPAQAGIQSEAQLVQQVDNCDNIPDSTKDFRGECCTRRKAEAYVLADISLRNRIHGQGEELIFNIIRIER